MTVNFDFNGKTARIIYIVIAALSVVGIILSLCKIVVDEAVFVPEYSLNTVIEHENATVSPVDGGTGHILDPDAEVRGVWIATVNNINFPSKKGLGADKLKLELDSIIDTCVKNNINAIYFQVRPSSDALYKSEIFPVSEYLTGKQGSDLPDLDPLDYLVKTAHERGIKVHAWVNPLRVTYGTREKPAHDVTALSTNHPARSNPGYTVAYADGKLYYNAGLPEVRELVVSGVREIAKSYDVDGIVFDDYFYPYIAYNADGSKAVFDDAAAYKLYGGKMTLGDFRRDNINKLVEACYNAIKEEDHEMLFGISPFGIWQNDDGKNGGSDTDGTEAYNELYSDALAWINGGYIDYIAPQIYWKFNNESARYDTLVRWWNAACDGTGVDLLISHGIYRYADEWSDSKDEIRNQIGFARSEISYRGSILYGYDVLNRNINSICDELESVFADEIIYSEPQSDNTPVSFNSPANGSTLTEVKQTYVLGSSDPAYPVYFDGQKLSRTKSGYFSVMLELNKGKNEFVFTQNGSDYTYTIYNGTSQQSASSGTIPTYKIMEKYEIVPITPTHDKYVSGGEVLTVSVKAPSGSSVTAALGDITAKLKAEKNSPGTDKLYEMTYTGEIILPESDKILDLGELIIKASRGKYKAEVNVCRVRVGNEVIPIEVTADRTGLKTAPDSYYYDDFTSQAKGMRDNAVRLESGFYLLRVGGYVAADNVRELDTKVPIAKVDGAIVKSDGDFTKIYIDADVSIPMNGRVENGEFILNLYNVDTTSPATPKLEDNPLFESINCQISTKANSLRYHLKLKDEFNFFGFEFAYEDSKPVVILRNPKGLEKGDKPLLGKTIILDAGHGGKDKGASGSSKESTEAALNLKIVLSARDKLEALGAHVILTRDSDEYYALADRMNFAEDTAPDMLVSVHQNSMDYSVDVTKVRGLMALYWEYAGKSLAETLSESISESLTRLNRGASTQKLAMVRCERYPSTLIEVGFMTNVEEFEKTSSADGIEATANAIVDGIIDYYKRQMV
jgi:uncharacterized lipoprotein YddW (UPF0748 family)/N-acetylmuramoyl-L-alanine amidase